MSAYLCEDEHFRQLAAWLCAGSRDTLDRAKRISGYRDDEDGGPHYLKPEDLATFLARALKAENVRSLGARYGEGDTDGANAFEAKFIKPLSLGEVERMRGVDGGKIHHSTRCLVYQSCEASDWETTTAAELTRLIYWEIGHRIACDGQEAIWGQPCEFTAPPPQMLSIGAMMHDAAKGRP